MMPHPFSWLRVVVHALSLSEPGVARARYWIAAAALSLPGLLHSAPAHAAITLRIDQVGADVVVTGTGSANLNGLTANGSASDWSNYLSGVEVYVGPAVISSGSVSLFTGLSGPLTLGTLPTTFEFPDPASSSGDLFGIWTDDGSGVSQLVLPDAYLSGTSLSGTSTYPFLTLASLGLASGQVNTWTWGSGLDADSFTLEVHGNASVPAPAPAPILGALAAFHAARGLRRRQRT
mgnify:FL=1